MEERLPRPPDNNYVPFTASLLPPMAVKGRERHTADALAHWLFDVEGIKGERGQFSLRASKFTDCSLHETTC